MIPAGYLAKQVCRTPDWLKNESVEDIYSLSSCVSEAFCDYIPKWRHNGYWLFDSPAIIREVAAIDSIDLSNNTFFYYEVFEKQFDERIKVWESFEPEESFHTAVIEPQHKHFEGFDVVSFSVRTSPECSPLSCNHAAETIPVNRHCLLASLDEAKGLLEQGAFDNCEPGPYRIFAVYSCDAA
jgi:hypothetical protein